jgi:predicted GNAT family acetyltransferase
MIDRMNETARTFYAKAGFAARGDYDMLILEGEGLAALTTP